MMVGVDVGKRESQEKKKQIIEMMMPRLEGTQTLFTLHNCYTPQTPLIQPQMSGTVLVSTNARVQCL